MTPPTDYFGALPSSPTYYFADRMPANSLSPVPPVFEHVSVEQAREYLGDRSNGARVPEDNFMRAAHLTAYVAVFRERIRLEARHGGNPIPKRAGPHVPNGT
jgi:hypothetical protein